MEEILNPIQGSNGTPPPIGIGERLRTARKSMHLSEKEAAARLNLNTSLIDLMENENFHKGPHATFMRGYLRSYGRLLNFNDHDINIAINELNLSAPQNTLTSTPTLPKKEEKVQLDRYLRLSSYFVITLLLGLVVVWWSSHPRYNEAEILSNQQVASAAPTAINAPEINTTPPNAIASAAIENKPDSKIAPAPTLLAAKPTTPTPVAAAITATPTLPSPAKPIHVAASHDMAAENINDVDDDASGENVY